LRGNDTNCGPLSPLRKLENKSCTPVFKRWFACHNQYINNEK
jgi:hypothetical protein